jgi:hypothetical protein
MLLNIRRVTAALGLAAYAALHGWNALTWPQLGPARYCEAFWSIGCALGAFVLLRPTFWARRYALGCGMAGLLNIAAYFGYFRTYGGLYFGVLQTAAFLAIVLLLTGKKMRAFYDERAEHWHFDHPTMHLLAAALSLNIAGIAMLVYYASLESSWTTPALRIGAIVTAAFLGIGTVLATSGRIAGLFVMTLAGIASLYLGWSALTHIHEPGYLMRGCGTWEQWQLWGRWETVKSLVGFVPGAMGSLLCFGVFLGPMIRFVRARAAS